MKSSQSSLEAQFGPLQKKTFASALSLFFEQQCPQMGGYPPYFHIENVVWSFSVSVCSTLLFLSALRF